MKEAVKTGLSFGLTSGIITTLGLMVGLYAGTHSKLSVIGGILTIAIADAMSDALGMHMSQESRQRQSTDNVWLVTFATFATKFIIALSFLLPVFLFRLDLAMILSVSWGLVVLSSINFFIAKSEHQPAPKVIREHIGIAALVVLVTFYLGKAINYYLG